MKKGILAILAMLTVSALLFVSCGGGGGGSSSSKKKGTVVSFELNIPTNDDGEELFDAEELGIEKPANRTVPFNTPIGELPAFELDLEEDGWILAGWSTYSSSDDDDFDFVNAETEFGTEKTVTLYAIWQKYDPVEITFIIGSGAWSAENTAGSDTTGPKVTVHRGSMIGDNLPKDPFKNGNVFKGWYTAASAGTKVTNTTVVSSFAATGAAFILRAQYEAEPALATGVEAAAKEIPADGEWYVAKNSFQIVYTFELPDGKTWGDYEGIEASYWVKDWTKEGSARTVRLYGNYKATDFKLYKFKNGLTPEPQLGAEASYAIASIKNLSDGGPLGNGEYILTDRGSGYSQKLEDFLISKLGYTKTVAEGSTTVTWKDADGTVIDPADHFFTVKYPIDGTDKNGSYNMANLPHPRATGPFYFGLAIPGQDNINVGKVKNVILKGKGTTDPLQAKAAYLKDADDNEYPMFCGYDGGTQTTPADVVYTLTNAENDAGAVYRGDDEPEIATGEDPTPPAATDLEVITAATKKKNSSAFTGQYQVASELIIPFTFPADTNISSYEKITVKVIYYDSDDEVIPITGWDDVASKGELHFVSSVTPADLTGSDFDDYSIAVRYNVSSGTQGQTTAYTIPSAVLNVASTCKGIVIRTGNAASANQAAYIEVVEVTLHAFED
jgi:hypothetical protein